MSNFYRSSCGIKILQSIMAHKTYRANTSCLAELPQLDVGWGEYTKYLRGVLPTLPQNWTINATATCSWNETVAIDNLCRRYYSMMKCWESTPLLGPGYRAPAGHCAWDWGLYQCSERKLMTKPACERKVVQPFLASKRAFYRCDGLSLPNCMTCGYFNFTRNPWMKHPINCITCAPGYELDVYRYSRKDNRRVMDTSFCTGRCVRIAKKGDNKRRGAKTPVRLAIQRQECKPMNPCIANINHACPHMLEKSTVSSYVRDHFKFEARWGYGQNVIRVNKQCFPGPIMSGYRSWKCAKGRADLLIVRSYTKLVQGDCHNLIKTQSIQFTCSKRFFYYDQSSPWISLTGEQRRWHMRPTCETLNNGKTKITIQYYMDRKCRVQAAFPQTDKERDAGLPPTRCSPPISIDSHLTYRPKASPQRKISGSICSNRLCQGNYERWRATHESKWGARWGASRTCESEWSTGTLTIRFGSSRLCMPSSHTIRNLKHNTRHTAAYVRPMCIRGYFVMMVYKDSECLTLNVKHNVLRPGNQTKQVIAEMTGLKRRQQRCQADIQFKTFSDNVTITQNYNSPTNRIYSGLYTRQSMCHTDQNGNIVYKKRYYDDKKCKQRTRQLYKCANCRDDDRYWLRKWKRNDKLYQRKTQRWTCASLLSTQRGEANTTMCLEPQFAKHCPVTCRTCGIHHTAAQATYLHCYRDMCADDPSWEDTRYGDGNATCATLAQNRAWCNNYDRYSAEARRACPLACGVCGCRDTPGWKDTVYGDGTATCADLVRHPAWCANNDAYSREARRACPASCGLCGVPHALDRRFFRNWKMTVKMCIDQCAFYNLPLAGLDGGVNCRCGSEQALGRLRRVSELECGMQCVGDAGHPPPARTCGGKPGRGAARAVSLYRVVKRVGAVPTECGREFFRFCDTKCPCASHDDYMKCYRRYRGYFSEECRATWEAVNRMNCRTPAGANCTRAWVNAGCPSWGVAPSPSAKGYMPKSCDPYYRCQDLKSVKDQCTVDGVPRAANCTAPRALSCKDRWVCGPGCDTVWDAEGSGADDRGVILYKCVGRTKGHKCPKEKRCMRWTPTAGIYRGDETSVRICAPFSKCHIPIKAVCPRANCTNPSWLFWKCSREMMERGCSEDWPRNSTCWRKQSCAPEFRAQCRSDLACRGETAQRCLAIWARLGCETGNGRWNTSKLAIKYHCANTTHCHEYYRNHGGCKKCRVQDPHGGHKLYKPQQKWTGSCSDNSANCPKDPKKCASVIGEEEYICDKGVAKLIRPRTETCWLSRRISPTLWGKNQYCHPYDKMSGKLSLQRCLWAVNKAPQCDNDIFMWSAGDGKSQKHQCWCSLRGHDCANKKAKKGWVIYFIAGTKHADLLYSNHRCKSFDTEFGAYWSGSWEDGTPKRSILGCLTYIRATKSLKCDPNIVVYNQAAAQNKDTARVFCSCSRKNSGCTRKSELSGDGTDGWNIYRMTDVPHIHGKVLPTLDPTASPTASPTKSPTLSPTKAPTASPSTAPTNAPSTSPSAAPSGAPTIDKYINLQPIRPCIGHCHLDPTCWKGFRKASDLSTVAAVRKFIYGSNWPPVGKYQAGKFSTATHCSACFPFFNPCFNQSIEYTVKLGAFAGRKGKHPEGWIRFREWGRTTVTISYHITGLRNHKPGTIRILPSKSCAAAKIGHDPLYNKKDHRFKRNPWTANPNMGRYNVTVIQGETQYYGRHGEAEGEFTIDIGYSAQDVNGHAFVVYGPSTNSLACGVAEGGSCSPLKDRSGYTYGGLGKTTPIYSTRSIPCSGKDGTEYDGKVVRRCEPPRGHWGEPRRDCHPACPPDMQWWRKQHGEELAGLSLCDLLISPFIERVNGRRTMGTKHHSHAEAQRAKFRQPVKHLKCSKRLYVKGEVVFTVTKLQKDRRFKIRGLTQCQRLNRTAWIRHRCIGKVQGYGALTYNQWVTDIFNSSKCNYRVHEGTAEVHRYNTCAHLADRQVWVIVTCKNLPSDASPKTIVATTVLYKDSQCKKRMGDITLCAKNPATGKGDTKTGADEGKTAKPKRHKLSVWYIVVAIFVVLLLIAACLNFLGVCEGGVLCCESKQSRNKRAMKQMGHYDRMHDFAGQYVPPPLGIDYAASEMTGVNDDDGEEYR